MNIAALRGKEFEAAADLLGEKTVAGLLEERAREQPHAIALRYKRDGVYRELRWREYRDAVRATARMLLNAGVKQADFVCTMGGTCIEYLLLDLATTYCGAVSCGIYPTSSPSEVAYLLKLVRARLFFAETQEHLDRLLAAEAEAGGKLVETIVVADTRALFLYEDPRIIAFDQAGEPSHDGVVEEELTRRLAQLRPESLYCVTFTSGTTGAPKAACSSHRAALVGLAYAFLETLPELREGAHRTLSFLPLAHGIERGMTLLVPLIANVVPHLGERNQNVVSLMIEVRPTFVQGVPRIWEKLAAQIQVGAETSGWLARKAFRAADAIGRKRIAGVWARGWSGPATTLLYWAALALVLWPARHKLGLLNCTGAVCAGAPLPRGVQETWQAWGIPLRDVWGMTETWVVGGQQGRWPVPGSEIVAARLVVVKRESDGELLIRGPGVLSSYFRDEAATRALFSEDGYVRSGDVVSMAEGSRGFRMVDRKKDIIITSGGKNISPAALENALKASPYITEVIVFGDNRKFVSALLELDFETVSHWARQKGIAYTGVASLARDPAIRGLIEAEVQRCNQVLARVEQVKKFWIIDRELVPEDGDTTPTRKVKRAHAYKTYRAQVEALYAEVHEAGSETATLRRKVS